MAPTLPPCATSRRPAAAATTVACLAAALALLACGHASAPSRASAASPPSAASPAAARVASNILRADYAGSAACRDCHPREYAAWQSSPMHNMTRLIDGATVRAPFDGATLTVGTDTVTMFTRDGARFVRVDAPHRRQVFRVTKVIGGRIREDFAGVDVTDEHDQVHDPGYGGERIMPATYVFSTSSWRYKGYSVMVPERPASSTRARWSETCIACHNTLPYVTLLYDDLEGPRTPSYQGKVSDHLLPADRSWTATSTDDAGLAAAVDDELVRLGADRPKPWATLARVVGYAATTSRKQLGQNDLVEVGIGCEACHGGSAAHAADPTRRPTFEVTSPLLRVAPPPRAPATDAAWIDHTCARCHTVLFTRYPWTWEGGRRSDPLPGGSTTTSGEARDFQLGGCATKMACTHCHDPHAQDDPAKLAAMATPAGNATCTSCHAELAATAAVEAHSHHKASGAGASCVACHMPRKNMGLDYALDRYHRIGSPDDPTRVEKDRPLECALCHVDRSVDQLVGAMERWWGKRYDRAALRGLYGDDLGVDVLAATIARGKPHEQAAAMMTLGDARVAAAVPLIAPQLAHDYPLVRYFARRALEEITGAPVPVDVGAPAAQVTAAARAWLEAWKAHAPSPAPIAAAPSTP